MYGQKNTQLTLSKQPGFCFELVGIAYPNHKSKLSFLIPSDYLAVRKSTQLIKALNSFQPLRWGIDKGRVGKQMQYYPALWFLCADTAEYSRS